MSNGQKMINRPSKKFLEELGWLTMKWSSLETMIELSCAYLFQARFSETKDGKPPKPFGGRVKFIRRGLNHPAFTHIRGEYEHALKLAEQLSIERNNRIHGAFTSYSNFQSPQQTIIKSTEGGYIAQQGVSVSENDLADLSERIGRAFTLHFNLMDRMTATIRTFEGKSEMGRRMKFHD
jgi:hypothetical protein